MIAKQVYLICDGDMCPQSTNMYDANDAKEARRIAHAMGSRCPPIGRGQKGRDLCRSCATKEGIK